MERLLPMKRVVHAATKQRKEVASLVVKTRVHGRTNHVVVAKTTTESIKINVMGGVEMEEKVVSTLSMMLEIGNNVVNATTALTYVTGERMAPIVVICE